MVCVNGCCHGRGWRRRRVNSRRWRRVRELVLVRDGAVCRMVEGCSTPATTVDHVIPLVLGGCMWDPRNLRAACAAHNFGAGALLSGASRPDLGTPSRTWAT